ncbi:hypothetical protein [uncultured Bifidobacterium sp.]|uniref:hypothetical protein n=1 Tax=uncultured Bifidobacterium sp. TaxID=165187 RepID=UPI0025960598|nr:hypothetical protein [uncultured Bifidobacterium sp.]
MSESNPDEFKDDGPSFSDEELEAALAGFEAEFRDEVSGTDPAAQEADGGPLPDGVTVPDDASELTGSFDDELEGLLGNKAKTAMIITQLASADLLAAFCQLADVSATCLEDAQGAVAVLRNLDGDGPEAAAKDLTCVVSGMPVILAVNRADKLEATLYVKGHPGQTFAPPILFTQTPPFVEDLMLGIGTVDGVIAQGVHTVDSGSLDREAAMKVIAQHTRFGRGSSKIQ